MWKSVSLSYLEYKDLSKTIDDFIKDMDKLRDLQTTGHVPLILSQKKETEFKVTIAPDTLEILSKIDNRFTAFNKEVSPTSIDMHIIDSHDLLMGNKETFKNKILNKRELAVAPELV